MAPKSILMIAGEASGDAHGAHLIRALHRQHGSVRVWGMGGRAMRAAGAQIVVDADRLAVVGITEVVAKVPRLIKAASRLKKLMADTVPDLLILIDFPDFNLHMAGYAKKLNIPVLYYISPQIWAWRANRMKRIKARVDHMAVILPFEEAFYERHGVPVTFVGHPLMDAVTDPCARPKKGPSTGEPVVVGLLPGSRDREVLTLLPIMLQAGRLLQEKMGPLRFIVSKAPSIEAATIRGILERQGLLDVEMNEEPAGDLLGKCHLAIVASGTVTLEGAIGTTPMIITYMVSPVSYWLGRALIRVEHIGLVNLIAGRRIVPELIQHEVNPRAVCDTAAAILSDTDTYTQICKDLETVRDRLGRPGASHKVARIACALMGCDHAVR